MEVLHAKTCHLETFEIKVALKMSDNSEEEQFGDDDSGEEFVVDINDIDGDIILDESFDIPTEYVEAPREPERDWEMEDLMGRFKPTTGAAKRLLTDYREVIKTDPKTLGFQTQPNGSDIFNWEVRLFGFDEKSPMADDMARYKTMSGRDYVEMRISFPPDYPNNPPFVRVIQPRFVMHTGRITVGGSLCMDILTSAGWNPMYDIQSLMVNVMSAIIDGGPRIDFRQPGVYSLQEAHAAFTRVAGQHGWAISRWLPTQ